MIFDVRTIQNTSAPPLRHRQKEPKISQPSSQLPSERGPSASLADWRVAVVPWMFPRWRCSGCATAAPGAAESVQTELAWALRSAAAVPLLADDLEYRFDHGMVTRLVLPSY